MTNSISIGEKVFYISKPVFIILDTLKKEIGFDFALGMDDKKIKDFMNDLTRVPKAISLMTMDTADESFDEVKAEEREKYLYRNAEISDFVKVLGFFFRQLNVSEKDLPEQSTPVNSKKESKNKMSLVKKV